MINSSLTKFNIFFNSQKDNENGLIVWFPFVDGSINDQSGYGYPVAPINGPVPVDDIIPSYKFISANSQYLSITSNALLNSVTAFTYTAWIKAVSFPNAYNFILNKQDATHYWQLAINSSGKIVCYLFANADVSTDGTGPTTLNTGQWYHIAATYDSVNGLKTYINSIQETSAAANGNLATTTNTNGLVVGAQIGLTRYWNGNIGDARVYNRALSASEINAIYLQGLTSRKFELPFEGFFPVAQGQASVVGYSNSINPNAIGVQYVNTGGLAGSPGGGSASITPPLPTNRVNGNLLVATWSNSHGADSMPSGWTQIFANVNTLSAAYRFVDGTETAPTLGASTDNRVGQVSQYSGVNPTAPIGASSSHSGSSSTFTCPSLVTTGLSSLVVYNLWTVSNNIAGVVNPSGFVNDSSGSALNGGCLQWSHILEPNFASTVGPVSSSSSVGGNYSNFMFELFSNNYVPVGGNPNSKGKHKKPNQKSLYFEEQDYGELIAFKYNFKKKRQSAATFNVAQIYNVSLSEAASAIDNLSITVSYAALLTEAASAVDSPSVQVAFNPSILESAVASDSPSVQVAFNPSLLESASASDSLSVQVAFNPSILESASASDSPSVQVAFNPALTEAASATDALTATADYHLSLGEVANASDNFSVAVAFALSLLEFASANDNLSIQVDFAASLNETASASDVVSAGEITNVSLNEAANAIDSYTATVDFNPSLSEVASAIDNPTATADFHLSLNEVANALDFVLGSAAFAASLSEAANATDNINAFFIVDVSLNEAANATDNYTVTVDYNVSITEVASAQDVLVGGIDVFVELTETANAVDSFGVTADFNVSLVDALTVTEKYGATAHPLRKRVTLIGLASKGLNLLGIKQKTADLYGSKEKDKNIKGDI